MCSGYPVRKCTGLEVRRERAWFFYYSESKVRSWKRQQLKEIPKEAGHFSRFPERENEPPLEPLPLIASGWNLVPRAWAGSQLHTPAATHTARRTPIYSKGSFACVLTSLYHQSSNLPVFHGGHRILWVFLRIYFINNNNKKFPLTSKE